MGKKKEWKKIDTTEADRAIAKTATEKNTKQMSVDDLFTIDTTGDAKKGASSAIRKGIFAAEKAPVVVGKSKEHIKLLEKVEKKMESWKAAPKKAVSGPEDLWGDAIEGKTGPARKVLKPESIPYLHVPAVPLPSHAEAFNPAEEELKRILAYAAKEVTDKEAQEKELVEMRRPMTHFLHGFLGAEDMKVLDDITQQRVFRAAQWKIDLPLIKAAVLRHKILGDEKPLLNMAQGGFVPENLMAYEGSLATFADEIKPDAGDDEITVSASTINLVNELFIKQENDGESDNEEEVLDLSDDDEESKVDSEVVQKKRGRKYEIISTDLSTKKSKYQRNKEERHKALMAEHDRQRTIKKGLATDVPVILKELKQRYKALADRAADKKQAEDELKAQEALGYVAKPKKLGPQRFVEAPKAVPLPSEVVLAGGSLRKMKLESQLPVANPIIERFQSMQRRGAVVATPDILSVQHQKKKREEAIKAAKARKHQSSTRVNYDEANLV